MNRKTSVTIHPTLTYCVAEPPTLDHAQDVVGGWVECLYLPGDAQMAEAFDNDRARSAAVKEQAREAVKAKLRERGLMHIGKDFGWPTFRGIEGRIHVNHDANIVLEFGALSLPELLNLINEENK